MKHLLVIAYLSSFPHYRPSIETAIIENKAQCTAKAVQVYKNVKVGTVRTWCVPFMEIKNGNNIDQEASRSNPRIKEGHRSGRDQ